MVPHKTVLLTSFRPWLVHHVSNASDDLLARLEAANLDFADFVFLRQLPVETAIASEKTIQAIAQYQPDLVVCCGMAETRDRLTVESQAFENNRSYQTSLDLAKLTASLRFTEVSNDAGKFVCEGLYFRVLQYLKTWRPQAAGLFLHVPLITPENEIFIWQDTIAMLRWLTQIESHKSGYDH
ncbi:pyrrolidone-carboxylate peptidase [[Synechococcus] sp. NIES-970]|nr:pyrrolidone-carboxylate peptidase [[Synechococcus] sp. NIES-970]